MVKKLLVMSVILAGFMITLVTIGEDFTDNKCFDEWTWCNDSTPDENAYWWEAGWCAAAIEAGVIGGSVPDCTSTPDDDYVAPVVEEEDDDDKKKNKAKEDPYAGIDVCEKDGGSTGYFLYNNDTFELLGTFDESQGYPSCNWR